MRRRWTNQGEALFSLVHVFSLSLFLSFFFLFSLFKEEKKKFRKYFFVSIIAQTNHYHFSSFLFSPSSPLSLSFRLEKERKREKERKYFSLDFLLIYESRLFEERKVFRTINSFGIQIKLNPILVWFNCFLQSSFNLSFFFLFLSLYSSFFLFILLSFSFFHRPKIVIFQMVMIWSHSWFKQQVYCCQQEREREKRIRQKEGEIEKERGGKKQIN